MATFTTNTDPAQVVATFEAHLQSVQRHEPGTPSYAESRYSRLVEGLIVAWFARKAFVEHYWQTDTRAMLVEWLSPAECSPSSLATPSFIEGFRRVLCERAQTHLRCSMAQDGTIRFENIGLLGPQYRDIDVGIIQTNPTQVALVASALCEGSTPVGGPDPRSTALAQLKVLAAIARADGGIDQRELRLLQAYCEENSLTTDDLDAAISGPLRLRKDDLPEQPWRRQELLHRALAIARADAIVSAPEATLLSKVAELVGVSRDRLKTLIRASMPTGAPVRSLAPTKTTDQQSPSLVSLPSPIDGDADDQLEIEITAHISTLAECPCLVQVLASPHWGWMLLNDPRILAVSLRDSPRSARTTAKTALLRIIYGKGARLDQCQFRIVLCDNETTWCTDFGDPTSVLRIDVKPPGYSSVRGVGVGCVAKNAQYIVWDWDA